MEKTIPCNGFKYDLLWEVGLNDAKENGVWVMGEEADRLWIRYCCWCDQRRQLSENANSTSWSNQKSPFRITEAELKGAESWAWNIPAGKETEKLTGLRGLDQISHQETEGAWIFLGCGWKKSVRWCQAWGEGTTVHSIIHCKPEQSPSETSRHQAHG